jgi:hypothetical protein
MPVELMEVVVSVETVAVVVVLTVAVELVKDKIATEVVVAVVRLGTSKYADAKSVVAYLAQGLTQPATVIT